MLLSALGAGLVPTCALIRVCVCVAVYWVGCHSTSLVATELNALSVLYSSTGGASWTAKASWMDSGVDPCSWYGVTCNSAGTHALRVSLSTNHLDGTIPTEVGEFTELTGYLLLQSNTLSGTPLECWVLACLRCSQSNSHIRDSTPA